MKRKAQKCTECDKPLVQILLESCICVNKDCSRVNKMVKIE